jgi:TBC1 domain family protein 5
LVRRSLHWKLALSILPSPTPEIFQTSLQTTRQAYDQLRVSYLRSPDGRYPTDVSVPPSSTTATYASLPVPNGGGGQEVFDPLSLEEESPWKKYYTDLEVRKEIRKDVERT